MYIQQENKICSVASGLFYVLFSHSAECPSSLWMATCGDIYSLVISCLYKQSRSGSRILLHILLKTDACAEFNIIIPRDFCK